MAEAGKAPVLSATPTVLAAWFCPFAQRTLIAFHAKAKPAADFTIHEITHDDLYSKPAWFTDLNPAGLIPVIAWNPQAAAAAAAAAATGDTAAGDSAAAAVVPAAVCCAVPAAVCCAVPGAVSIKESLVCNDYIEDAYPEPPLLPADAVGRAAARLLIQRFGDKFVPSFYKLLVTQDAAGQAAAAAVLESELAWLMQHMDAARPFALSGQLSLVDCAVVPFLLRLHIVEHYRGFQGHKQRGVAERLQRYLQAAEQHPAVAASMYHPQGLDYKQQLLLSYARYADGSANSLMAREAKAKK
uniref:GST C-terminal domain-containing protein n=1 Tax=Tetradesmus obliquus TaxID=3088 RepID=A0A383VQ52_TETOB|eukprot:jgi/Sobl393_1/8516/SZX66536.1